MSVPSLGASNSTCNTGQLLFELLLPPVYGSIGERRRRPTDGQSEGHRDWVLGPGVSQVAAGSVSYVMSVGLYRSQLK